MYYDLLLLWQCQFLSSFVHTQITDSLKFFEILTQPLVTMIMQKVTQLPSDCFCFCRFEIHCVKKIVALILYLAATSVKLSAQEKCITLASYTYVHACMHIQFSLKMLYTWLQPLSVYSHQINTCFSHASFSAFWIEHAVNFAFFQQ